ncbi:thioesterase II family protein [Aeoliella sp.]|uniref:thioesterase II family protein n=1 Tax=Aeoliella sp. TaxID=2795800 RepID=UPI003CCBD274
MTRHPLLPTTLPSDAQRRLFCFPHAGGGAAAFYRWSRYLPNDVALVPLRLPGREDRLGETPYADLAQLADDAAEAVASLAPLPSLFVGHSLGGYVALEVTKRLLDTSHVPSKLIVAACGAPRGGRSKSPIGQLDDDAFVDAVATRYDGIPDLVRQSPELLAMVLPALRADIQMIESYDYQPTTPLPIDILALGGTDDGGVSPHRLNEWRNFTGGSFQMRLFPGGHFFLHPAPRREAAAGAARPAPLSLICDQLPASEGTA